MEQPRLTSSSKKPTFAQLVDSQLPIFDVAMDVEWVGGKQGAIAGASFENLVLLANRGYEVKHLGTVKKNHIRTKFLGGKYIRAAKSTVDFDGYLKDVGFVAFDCKSTSEKHWIPKREQLHQFLYLYRGQLELNIKHGRFFYLIERHWKDETKFTRRAVYLVENLEDVKQTGRYEFSENDVVSSGLGVPVDYRAKLLAR